MTDDVMAEINTGLQQHISGDRAGAREKFTALWERIGEDGDPLHRCALAHYMADVCDDPADELAWDLRALAAADSLTDERAQEYHATLAVRGFYPSLHLNLAEDYRKLGDHEAAKAQWELGRGTLGALGDDPYGQGIFEAYRALATRLGLESDSPDFRAGR